MVYAVYRVDFIEHEWGMRPDGHALCRDLLTANSLCDGYPKYFTGGYVEATTPRLVEVTQEVHDDVMAKGVVHA